MTDPSLHGGSDDGEHIGSPTLRLVDGDDLPRPERYDPAREYAVLLHRCARKNDDGRVVGPGQVTKRIEAMMAAWWWPVRDGDTVWLSPRRHHEFPAGGILSPYGRTEEVQRCQARFAAGWPMEPIPSESTVKSGMGAFAGTAARLEHEPWLRWGRSADGALWWDAGRADGRCVRVDEHGWTVEDRPACWFRRTPAVKELPLPAKGGRLDDLWDFVTVSEQDRPIVVAWMLAATQPERERAAGMLYLSGPEGSGKSASADKITEACGSTSGRKRIKTRQGDDRDLLVGASAGWVLGLDNLSALTSDEQDLLCTLITGHEETYRTLYSTVDHQTLSIRRPVVATSIEIPVLRPDLISRMLPVEVHLPDREAPEDELAERWRRAQPAVFGAVLDLLVQVMATGSLPLRDAPRLAVLGRMAAAADRVRGTDTLAQLQVRQSELLRQTVSDDPFFDTLRAGISGRWVGTATELGRHLDPDGELARRHGKQWPTGRAIGHRIKRHQRALERDGWTVRCDTPPVGGRGQVWTITTAPSPTASPGGGTLHAPGCHCASCPRPVPGCQCGACNLERTTGN